MEKHGSDDTQTQVLHLDLLQVLVEDLDQHLEQDQVQDWPLYHPGPVIEVQDQPALPLPDCLCLSVDLDLCSL